MYRKKKILYIHHGKGLGGAPLSLLYLIENLDKEKYHPIVLFLQGSQVVDLYKSKGIEVYGPLNLYDFSHTKICWYKWYHPHLFFKVLKDTFKTIYYVANYWFEKIQPDLVHLNTSSLIAWAKVAYKKNIPVIFHVREPLAKGYLGFRKKIIKKYVDKYSSAIVPICKNDSLPWKTNSKVNIIYNAVDSKKFNRNILMNNFLLKYNLSTQTPKILFLGGLSKEKGTLIIFEIFKRLLKLRSDVQLLVAGDFNLQICSKFNLKNHFPSQVYKKRVNKILQSIKKNVLFLGAINNIEEVMAACDVIVFPATVGHFARPIIEAGFMAKPVVASKLAPLNELIIDGKTGFLIEPQNYKMWVEKLNMLLINEGLNKKIGENGYQYCIKNFDIKDQIKKIQNIYKKRELIL
ncbi:glycosyltransferase [Candidatus Dependentiae bacterium]|nr:glycosyltransferase [Candidatus Dependentiae bacterium]